MGALLTAIWMPEAGGLYLVPTGFLLLIGSALAVSGWRRRHTLLSPMVLGGVMIAWGFGLSPYVTALRGYQPTYSWVTSPLIYAMSPVGWLHLVGVVVGLMASRTIWRRRTSGRVVRQVTPITWSYNRTALLIMTVLTATLLVVAISRVGVRTFFSPAQSGQDTTLMAGMGVLLWIGSSVFLILALWIFLAMRAGNANPKTAALLIMVLLFMVVRLLFGGLHGSRAATVWAVVWFLLLFDVIVRPVNWLEWGLVAIGGLCFTYVYGLYKSVGAEVTEALSDVAIRSSISQVYNRSMEDVFLGDLSRAGVHALLWQRLSERNVAPLGYGRTYLAAISLALPRGLLWERPPTKSVVGAAVESDLPIRAARELPGTRQYGISGEAALNFGPLGFLLGAMIFVMLTLWLGNRDEFGTVMGGGANLLTTRLLSTLLPSVMLSDIDNWAVLLVRLSPVLFIIPFAIRRKTRSTGPTAPFPTVGMDVS